MVIFKWKEKAVVIFSLVIFGLAVFWVGKISVNEADAILGTGTSVEMMEGVSPEQKVVQETAAAFYRKGSAIQYALHTGFVHYLSPEEATSQDWQYSSCDPFEFAVYYNAFGMALPSFYIGPLMSYAEKYYPDDGAPDIKYLTNYENDGIQMTNEAEREDFFKNLLNVRPGETKLDKLKIEVGDILMYTKSGGGANGHYFMVYDFVYENGERKDAILLESKGNLFASGTNLSGGLSFSNNLNEETDTHEGTVKYSLLSKKMNVPKTATPSKFETSEYFIVYRPLALVDDSDDSELLFNDVTCQPDSNNEWGYTCTKATKTFDYTASAKGRQAYPGIDIEKTVDAYDNGVVQPGDRLTYSIKITNNHSADYNDVKIIENIPTEYVETASEENVLEWTIPKIAAGQSYTHSYTVNVKKDSSLVGQDIVSTGTVGGITSAKVVNHIGVNLTETEKEKLKISFDDLKNQYSGVELIDQVYQSALGVNPGFSGLIIGAHYNLSSDSVSVKEKNETCNPYFSREEINALIETNYGHNVSKIRLNEDNEFSKILLNSYYSAVDKGLTFTDSTHTECKNDASRDYLINFDSGVYKKSPDELTTSGRKLFVMPGVLQTGDVLIYANAGAKNGDEVQMDPKTQEKGIYAFIWIEDEEDGGNFYGVNQVGTIGEVNMVYGQNTTSTQNKPNNLLTLYGKDYFAIFRPSLAFEYNYSEPSGEESSIEVPNSGIMTKAMDGAKMVCNYLLGVGVVLLTIKLLSSIVRDHFNHTRVQFKKDK